MLIEIHNMNIQVKNNYSRCVFFRKVGAVYSVDMRLKQIRESKGLTQEDLAELIGASQPKIQRLEKRDGTAKLETLYKVAEVLGVSASEILADSRSEAELALIEAFRSLPAERQQGWLDMAQAASSQK